MCEGADPQVYDAEVRKMIDKQRKKKNQTSQRGGKRTTKTTVSASEPGFFDNLKAAFVKEEPSG